MAARISRAFTLIELIVVMAIIVTLSVIGFISYNSYIQDSRNAAREAQLNDIVKSIDQFIVTYGVPPKCNTTASNPNYCYFANHTSYSATYAKGTTGGWTPGASPFTTGSYGPRSEGILSTDWDKLNLKKVPMDPRNVYFLYAYNGSKYVIMGTKELSNGYAAIIKGSQAFEELSADTAKPNFNGVGCETAVPSTCDTNVVASASGLGIRIDGDTVAQGVFSPANPIAIKYNGFSSTTTSTAVTGNAGVPYTW